MAGAAKLRPQTNEPHIGIEIEFDVPEPHDREKILAEFDKYKSFCVVRYEHITFAADKEYGYEAAILATEKCFRAKLMVILRAIKRVNGYVDRRCGLHVHIDCRNRNYPEVYRKFSDSLEILWTKVDPTRKTVADAYYYPLMEGRNNYGTLEVRIHEGTLQYKKIRDWIYTLLEILHREDKLPEVA